jgi:hypothetical protein
VEPIETSLNALRSITDCCWRRELGDQIGREVSAVARGRDIDWTIGRDRGLEIG